MPAGGAVVAGVLGAVNLIRGIKQSNDASAMARNNVRPTYNIPQSAEDNLSLAEYRANQGLSPDVLDAYKSNSNRTLSASLNAILKGGGDVNQASNAQDVANTGLSRLAMADEQSRLQNIGALVAQRNQMADYQDKAYMMNSYGPYADRAAAAAAIAKNGNASINSGMGTISAAAGTLFKDIGQKQQINDVGGNGGSGSGSNPQVASMNMNSGGPSTLPQWAGSNTDNSPAPWMGNGMANNMKTNGSVFDAGSNQALYNVDWGRIKDGAYRSLINSGNTPIITNY